MRSDWSKIEVRIKHPTRVLREVTREGKCVHSFWLATRPLKLKPQYVDKVEIFLGYDSRKNVKTIWVVIQQFWPKIPNNMLQLNARTDD